MMRSLRALLLAPALATIASTVLAAPFVYPMPDGRQEVRDERDVARFLAAWKASALARQRAVAQPATANQLQYDARSYDLNLTFTPATSSVSGTVRIKASVVGGPISTLDLDLYSNMVVDAATSAGTATTYSRLGNVLTLNLDRAYDQYLTSSYHLAVPGTLTVQTIGWAFSHISAAGPQDYLLHNPLHRRDSAAAEGGNRGLRGMVRARQPDR